MSRAPTSVLCDVGALDLENGIDRRGEYASLEEECEGTQCQQNEDERRQPVGLALL